VGKISVQAAFEMWGVVDVFDERIVEDKLERLGPVAKFGANCRNWNKKSTVTVRENSKPISVSSLEQTVPKTSCEKFNRLKLPKPLELVLVCKQDRRRPRRCRSRTPQITASNKSIVHRPIP
jgi:hypothetical protein